MAKLTRKEARQVPIATVRRLFPLHARNNAHRSPAAALMTEPVE